MLHFLLSKLLEHQSGVPHAGMVVVAWILELSSKRVGAGEGSAHTLVFPVL